MLLTLHYTISYYTDKGEIWGLLAINTIASNWNTTAHYYT